MAGIGYRLQRGLGTVRGAYSDQKAREEREAERARIARQQALQNDIRLAELGGGRGAPPMRKTTIAPPPRLDEFEPPEGPLTGEPGPSMGVGPDSMDMPSLDLPPVPTATVKRPDPRYREVGDGRGHVMTPEARAAQEREREESRLSGIAERFQGAGLDEDEAYLRARGHSVPRTEERPGDWRLDTDEQGRRIRVNVDTGETELLGYSEPSPRTSSDEYVPTVEELRAAGIPEELIPIAQRDEVLRRQLLQGLVEDDEWEDPTNSNLSRAALAGTYPNAVAHYEETGVWDPSLDEGGAAGGEEGGDEGPNWVERRISDIGGLFGRDEAEATPPTGPGTEPEISPDMVEPPPRPGSFRHEAPTRDTPAPAGGPSPAGGETAGTPDAGGDTGASLEADIQEALAEGQTADQIISELESVRAPDEIIEQARQILSRIGG